MNETCDYVYDIIVEKIKLVLLFPFSSHLFMVFMLHASAVINKNLYNTTFNFKLS